MGMIKRDIAKLIESWGFEEAERGKVDIIVSEMASNLIKHKALNGQILVKQIDKKGKIGVEILCLDNGPGMHDPKRMMQDGVSTFGSAGEGLGAIQRLSNEFDLYSHFGVGTVVLSRLFSKLNETDKIDCPLSLNIVCVPKKGEIVSGDAWGFKVSNKEVFIMVADGLGHGPDANTAAVTAVNSFIASSSEQPFAILKDIHPLMKKTRGAVGSVVKINGGTKTMTYCGIGNISSRLVMKETTKSLVSYNGTLGFAAPTHMNDHVFPWEYAPLFIMHSDGLKSRWDMSRYPGLERHDGTVVAGVLYKDNDRGSDDCLVAIIK